MKENDKTVWQSNDTKKARENRNNIRQIRKNTNKVEGT